MKDKPINPIVGAAIAAVAVIVILALGYKLFLVPPPLPNPADHPPRPGYTKFPAGAGYPGGGATGYPGGKAATAAKTPKPATP